MTTRVGNNPVPCPVCSRPAQRYLTATDRNRTLSGEVFSYYRCSGCRQISLVPVPADLERYYPDTYNITLNTLSQVEQRAERERFKIEIVKQFSRTGRLLEIGPGQGCFALLAKQAGFDVEVIDRDENGCRFISGALGIPSHRSDDPIAGMQGLGSFDVIVLWHVIEHLPDIQALLHASAGHLNRSGHLIIATPNPESLQFRLLGSYWTHLDAPRHVALIPLDTLIEHGRKADLEPVWSSLTDRGGIELNRIGWQDSLALLARGRMGRKALRKLGSIVSAALSVVERTSRRGSAYTVAFRKTAESK